MSEHFPPPANCASNTFDAFLGRALSITRCAQALPITKVAAEVTITDEHLSKLEGGKVSATLEEIIALSEALNTSPHELIKLADMLLTRWQPSE